MEGRGVKIVALQVLLKSPQKALFFCLTGETRLTSIRHSSPGTGGGLIRLDAVSTENLKFRLAPNGGVPGPPEGLGLFCGGPFLYWQIAAKVLACELAV